MYIASQADGKASACNAGDLGSIPGLGGSPREGHGNPLKYSCLENPQNRGTWWAAKVLDTMEQLSTQACMGPLSVVGVGDFFNI